MWRTVGSIVAGLVAWAVVATLINFGLRAALPGYHTAEATQHFTLTMKIARLTMAAVTSIAAGAVVSWVAPDRKWAPWVVGLLLLAQFVPIHIYLWDKFPVWYHLTFLVTLAPLVMFGARLRPRVPGGAAKTGEPASAS